MALSRVLEMDFATELNKTHRLRVYDAREDLTSTDVETVMDNILAKNIFSGRGGELTDKIAARVITQETEEWDLL
ncbi:MAG: DUF2922 domain-containing protein [Syntrophomonadaceae bacterium]|jgi:RNase H-fold protein (predicted Holliday junction resolvase)